ncbi:hypothetical protein MPLB_1520003 [Mesorhizobium sp. ORS 3324]|nr:hypothetical protein MPLB_1520003 [Mesorhizobium sp. ORS 3324]
MFVTTERVGGSAAHDCLFLIGALPLDIVAEADALDI